MGGCPATTCGACPPYDGDPETTVLWRSLHEPSVRAVRRAQQRAYALPERRRLRLEGGTRVLRVRKRRTVGRGQHAATPDSKLLGLRSRRLSEVCLPCTFRGSESELCRWALRRSESPSRNFLTTANASPARTASGRRSLLPPSRCDRGAGYATSCAASRSRVGKWGCPKRFLTPHESVANAGATSDRKASLVEVRLP